MNYVILLLSLAMICEAQVPFFGRCPSKISPMKGFVASQYLGKWYEQEKYFAIFQFGGKCVTANYSLGNDNTINVFNQQLNILTSAASGIRGTARAVGAPDEARLEVVFPSVPFQIPAPYWVLDTDYSSYAVVYSCNDFVVFNTRFVWLLTRERSPSVSVMQAAYSVLDRNSIRKAFLIRTDQKNCPNSH